MSLFMALIDKDFPLDELKEIYPLADEYMRINSQYQKGFLEESSTEDIEKIVDGLAMTSRIHVNEHSAVVYFLLERRKKADK